MQATQAACRQDEDECVGGSFSPVSKLTKPLAIMQRTFLRTTLSINHLKELVVMSAAEVPTHS